MRLGFQPFVELTVLQSMNEKNIANIIFTKVQVKSVSIICVIDSIFQLPYANKIGEATIDCYFT